jgi:hypothetical protein
LDVGDQTPQRLALLGVGGRIVSRRPDQLHDLRRRHRRTPKLVDAPVVSHPVEPRAQRQLPMVGAQAGVRPDEDVLERVLGILPRAGQHLTRVREQPLAVSVVDDAECVIAASSEQRDQLLIRAQPQQRRPDRYPSPRQSCRCLEG